MYANTDQCQRREQVRTLAEQLYRERRLYLLRIAIKNALSREDAEEAVQGAFAAFIRAFDLDSGAPPLAWLTLTVKRSCWDKGNREHLELRASQDAVESFERGCLPAATSPAAGPEQAIERGERVIEARRDLARLKPAERRALGLIAAGYSYREVGQITGWTQTKINRCAREGRAVLRGLATK